MTWRIHQVEILRHGSSGTCQHHCPLHIGPVGWGHYDFITFLQQRMQHTCHLGDAMRTTSNNYHYHHNMKKKRKWWARRIGTRTRTRRINATDPTTLDIPTRPAHAALLMPHLLDTSGYFCSAKALLPFHHCTQRHARGQRKRCTPHSKSST